MSKQQKHIPGFHDCILCGRKPYIVGIWTPTPDLNGTLMVAPGKRRVHLYGLCRRCRRKPNAFARVEDKIIRDHKQMSMMPERN